MGPPRRASSVDRHSSRDAAPPPAQVFTRGRQGLVKTRPQSTQNRRAASMDPSHRNHQRSNRSSSKDPRSNSRTKRSTMSHTSVDIMSHAMSSDISEGDHSIYSAPALTPKKGDYSEHREPSSSRTSPSVIKQQHHQQQLNKRELTPERSIDIQKQHSRMTRKVVDGTFGCLEQ